MSPELPDIKPFVDGVFTLPPYDHFPPRLLGGVCSSCKQYFFPRIPYCRICFKPTEEAVLGSQGVLYSYTVIRTKAPLGLPTPYGVGYVDLAGSHLRVFCLLDPEAVEKFQVGLAVQLAVKPLGLDERGSPCLRPYFTPKQ